MARATDIVTMRDVAARAGVSRMTVSRVLNGRGGASFETQAKIRAAAEALSYRPNAAARRLRSKRSYIVGVIVPDISNPFFPEIFRGAERVAQAHGYTLMLSNVVESADREAEVFAKLRDQQVDGILWCSARMPEAPLAGVLQDGPDVVLVNRSVPEPLVQRGTVRSVTVDYGLGARLAVDHLVALGRRRIGVIAGPDWSYGARARLAGVEAALAQKGLGAVGTAFCDPTIEGGTEAAARLVAAGEPFDALISYNDLNAIGALPSLAASGLGVPRDVALIGFDDIDMARFVTPALTSLGVERADLGRSAMGLLLDLMEDREGEERIVLPPKLLLRASTDCAASSPGAVDGAGPPSDAAPHAAPPTHGERP